jgi:hypothetical protein
MGLVGCAVCVAGLEAAIPWYLATAIGMSLLPFAFVGVLGLWLHRRAKRAETSSSVDSARRD